MEMCEKFPEIHNDVKIIAEERVKLRNEQYREKFFEKIRVNRENLRSEVKKLTMALW